MQNKPRQTVPKRPAGAFLSSLAAVQVSAPPPERFSPRSPHKKPPHALHQLIHKIHGLFLPFANCFSSAAPTITETLSRHARSLEKLVPIRPVFLFRRRGVPPQGQSAKQPLLSPAGQSKIFLPLIMYVRATRDGPAPPLPAAPPVPRPAAPWPLCASRGPCCPPSQVSR